VHRCDDEARRCLLLVIHCVLSLSSSISSKQLGGQLFVPEFEHQHKLGAELAFRSCPQAEGIVHLVHLVLRQSLGGHFVAVCVCHPYFVLIPTGRGTGGAEPS